MSPQDRELMQKALEANEQALAYFDEVTYLREQTAPLRNALFFSSHTLRARLAELKTPAPTLFRVNLLRLCPTLTHEQIDELAAMARLGEPDDAPYCWVVSGCSTQYTGPHAEDCARDEATRIGRGTKAFPLYTRPADRMKWQPIETAPKDGTPIDVWRGVWKCRACNVRYVELSKDNTFFESVESGPMCIRDATYWMPSPPAPTGENDV